MLCPKTFIPEWTNMESIKNIPYVRLGNTDMIVSRISFGAAHVKNTEINLAIDSIRHAINSGINLLDTSPYYGMGISEKILGQALKTVPRNAYYISTKVGRHPDCSFSYHSDAIKNSVMESLDRLQLDYIDLVHVHDVEFCPSIDLLLTETLPTLEKLRNEGKLRYIGITGYPVKLLKEIIEKANKRNGIHIDAILSYCRYSLWDESLADYLPYFQSQGVGVINAAILGMGLFGDHVPEWHPAPEKLKQACQHVRSICQDSGNGITTVSRLALQHSLRESRIATHLVGMETSTMVDVNLDTVIRTNTTEKESSCDLMKRILESFGNEPRRWNWEGVELQRYRRDPEAFIRFLRQCWSSSPSSSGIGTLNE